MAVRERILGAAREELAEHGAAGARIERIAKRARTSKERVYAYFRTKHELLGEVWRARFSSLKEAVPMDVDDLPSYVGRLFDYYTSHPDELRLSRWVSLEAHKAAFEADDARLRAFQSSIEQIRAGQLDGRVDSSWAPADLFALLVATALAWTTAPPQLHCLSGDENDQLAKHRAFAVEAAHRLVTPRS